MKNKILTLSVTAMLMISGSAFAGANRVSITERGDAYHKRSVASGSGATSAVTDSGTATVGTATLTDSGGAIKDTAVESLNTGIVSATKGDFLINSTK